MKAFWGDKAIIVIGLKAGTAYKVEIQNSWLKKTLQRTIVATSKSKELLKILSIA
jgi:hypothetical protein